MPEESDVFGVLGHEADDLVERLDETGSSTRFRPTA